LILGLFWEGGRWDSLIAVFVTLWTTLGPAVLIATPVAEDTSVVATGMAASPMLTRLALGTANTYPFPAQALEAMLAALTTPAEPHCSPMHCATAVSHDGVSQRQESARQRQPEQEQVLESEQDEAAQTDWWQLSSQVG